VVYMQVVNDTEAGTECDTECDTEYYSVPLSCTEYSSLAILLRSFLAVQYFGFVYGPTAYIIHVGVKGVTSTTSTDRFCI
jgi:hypothetical protein